MHTVEVQPQDQGCQVEQHAVEQQHVHKVGWLKAIGLLLQWNHVGVDPQNVDDELEGGLGQDEEVGEQAPNLRAGRCGDGLRQGI